MMSSTNQSTRDRILTSCWRLLETGDAKTRMSDIAKKAGVSRQAVYLHFPNRTDLLVATTRFIDEKKNVGIRLERSRAAEGVDRLDAFIDAWGNYIPDIYGVARALLAMYDTDPEAAAAWDERMAAVREGCEAAIHALAETGQLTDHLTPVQATDALWTLLSVRTWEQLTRICDWTQADYINHMKRAAHAILVEA